MLKAIRSKIILGALKNMYVYKIISFFLQKMKKFYRITIYCHNLLTELLEIIFFHRIIYQNKLQKWNIVRKKILMKFGKEFFRK